MDVSGQHSSTHVAHGGYSPGVGMERLGPHTKSI